MLQNFLSLYYVASVMWRSIHASLPKCGRLWLLFVKVSVSGLQIFEWELGEAVIAAVGELMEGPEAALASKVSEKGVLQLLLDVRYLLDVLAGGRPMQRGARAGAGGVVDPVLNAALARRKKAQAEVESMLQVGALSRSLLCCTTI
jgi:hypothetical protein